MMEKNKKSDKEIQHLSGLDSDVLKKLVEKLGKKSHITNSDIMKKNIQCHLLPSKNAIIDIIEDLRVILFPAYFGPTDLTSDTIRYFIGRKLDDLFRRIKEQVKRGLCFTCKGKLNSQICETFDEQASTITESFLDQLPTIREKLSKDIKATYEGDPAATTPYETIFCYPGILAITNYRLAHELYKKDVPLIPRIITEHAHSVTGIDIHPGAEIGESFFIDHGSGVVIGETCIIGDHVQIYQGVTLGAKSFPLDEEGKPVKGIDRHPIVEDNVIIYSGATILGRITIGKNSVIGGNVWLTHSVAPDSRITQVKASNETFQKGGGI